MNKKVGSYAVTTIDFNSWIKEENTMMINKSKKQKNKKKLVHPIFLNFQPYTTDSFWIKKFNLFANGKLPKYFSFQDMKLSFQKSSEVSCLFTDDDLSNTKMCIQFFQTYGGIYSQLDEKLVSEELTESDYSQPETKVWLKLDKKSQELIIKDYVDQMTIVLKLTKKEANLLLQTILLAVSDKSFNKSNNIVYQHGKITEIKNLMWDQDKQFKINYTSVKKKLADSQTDDYPKDMMTQIQTKMNKYHDYYDKKYEKYKN